MVAKIPKTLQSKVTAWNKQNREHQKLAREINADMRRYAGKKTPKSVQSKIARYQKQTRSLTEKKAEIVKTAERNGLIVRNRRT